MKVLMALAERALLPDPLIRLGIRMLSRQRLRVEGRGDLAARRRRQQTFIQELRRSPIAVATGVANRQHYALPPAFFEKVLGRRMKYSACYWPVGTKGLDAAEEAMLALTCRRAGIEDGMQILELGCGWGAVSLWMAEKYPHSRILAVSNSRPQQTFIRERCRRRGLRPTWRSKPPTSTASRPTGASIAWFRWRCSNTCATGSGCSRASVAG
ncbi:MAG: class I SAM-dependent methyltransferase [Desulfobacterales bacterium]|nr:class I SAM-dependent methyltransferase [Desulfobacterales bacterium]